ncbi:DUF3883 domain-containing protein [Vibrio parahaemolyticus]|uniref:protein NO VEIN domain-containing protein n=1 Tax=Vibrio parahaemolyticus TaxID=670 RepID=UPI001375A198|nr:DUF3883 domain-containing protein [Vibrio parahaemolyticus]MCF9124767.1 DUF3883 domain-containing protein [Vibrio parahaemolyticus]NCM79367.1 DUF3883 domain-containing protein [Vibrio parahaemolyticus]
MNYTEIQNRLHRRLGENRGDRGWFVITRVHTDAEWIYQMTSYLRHLEDNDGLITMTDGAYQQLGEIGDLHSDDPGVQLRRHHLLVMNKPLQLIEKVNGRFWNKLRLTELGRELAVTSDPKSVLEQCLKNIQFAVPPSCPDDRAENYSEFNVAVYDAINQIMRSCDGHIDRDEYDLFVSRIRSEDEIAECIELVNFYRQLSAHEQAELLSVIRNTFTSDETKAYQNWRDMALHTFSLFSLGKTMVRDDQTLRLVDNWRHVSENISVIDEGEQEESSTEADLKLPKPDTSDFREPPTSPEENNGAAAESFVASVYRSEGWDVHFYTNKRGYGFDLWASKDDSAVYIEVKSSVDIVNSVTLTETEYKAAQKYRSQYMLVLVNNSGKPNQKLRILEDPFGKLEFAERATMSYSAVIPS